jgi:hypothetical protein
MSEMKDISRPLRWMVFQNDDEKFPYILCIEESPTKFLCLAAQEKWPGTNKKIFCHRVGYLDENELIGLNPVDCCTIKSSWNYGKKFEIILDRKMRKRCWFIILQKEYKTRPGEYYEQIFWVTQASARARGRKAYIPQGGKNESLNIIVDTRERYSWRFPECNIVKENLPVGDYALTLNDSIVAVVERKTKENLLYNLQSFEILRASLHELKTCSYRAVVFECSYADLINPKKNPYFKPSYIADVLAELYVLFPDIQIIFCDNRKIANEWTYRWFKRIHQTFKESDETVANNDLD